jgi:hypothetical protein
MRFRLFPCGDGSGLGEKWMSLDLQARSCLRFYNVATVGVLAYAGVGFGLPG